MPISRLKQPNQNQNYLNQSHPSQNRLLAALPELEGLIPHLELVPMALGDALWKAGRPLPAYAYFPTSAIISLHHILENGSSSASAGVGCEGMLGIPLFASRIPGRERQWFRHRRAS
ncbi:hypothetical protein [Nitrosospira multiformis]|uniref:hypothetical protein n=1 Tax=Nitrosospira multiformis TaxID=1231 RepID=UPI0020C92639|nr:hypothetical protein [Nitrosospira multiformis]